MIEFYDRKVWFYPSRRRNFLSQCWDAWSPKRRANRNRKLMSHPTPVVNLLWRIHLWVVMNKAERDAWSAEPWRVVLNFNDAHAILGDFEREWAPHFEEMGL